MYVFQPRFGAKLSPKHCCASVAGKGTMFSHQCNFKIKVQREYEGKTRGFCALHDPVVVKAKDEALHAKWDREAEEQRKAGEERTRRAKAYEAYRDALLAICNGANDARDRAETALRQNGDLVS